MSSSYNNVQTLLDVAESNDLQRLEDLLEEAYANSSYEYLAEDIAFVLISMWAKISPEVRKDFKESLTDDIVAHEISMMFDPEDDEEE